MVSIPEVQRAYQIELQRSYLYHLFDAEDTCIVCPKEHIVLSSWVQFEALTPEPRLTAFHVMYLPDKDLSALGLPSIASFNSDPNHSMNRVQMKRLFTDRPKHIAIVLVGTQLLLFKPTQRSVPRICFNREHGKVTPEEEALAAARAAEAMTAELLAGTRASAAAAQQRSRKGKKMP